MKLHNFNSGPSILPQPVLEQASHAIHNFNNTGLSILEIGHRTSHFQEVINNAISSVKRLMELDDQYEVLFLHGGATTQFMQVPMNLLDDDQTAGFVRHWHTQATIPPEKHQAYAVQWFGLAVTLTGLFIWISTRKRREHSA
jgi:phosphoserine aminotransferase